jgi:Concanavalin A-like lectin/glucanases superfamily
MIPGNSDVSATPTTISTASQSPDSTTGDPGTPWNDFLIAHRGSVLNQGVDDLFALKKNSNAMYLYENDTDSVGERGYRQSSDVYSIDTPACVATDQGLNPPVGNGNPHNCDTPGAAYPDTWSSVTQMISPGDVNGDHKPDLIAVQDGNLWLYRGSSEQNTYFGPITAADATYRTTPVLLGTGDWSGFTLLAPGTVGGAPTLWARNNATGVIDSFDLTPDANGLPPTLTAPVSTTHNPLPLTLPAASYPTIASPGDVNSPGGTGAQDGYPDLYAFTPAGKLIEYFGAAPTGTTAAFGSPITLGYTDNPTDRWQLTDGGSSTTAHDSGPGQLNATLNGTYSWATDPDHGTVLSLNGTNGYGITSGPAVNTGTYTDPSDGSTHNASFTVSAWVKLNDTSVNSTFVSQSDTAGNANAFQLYYSSTFHAWAFNRHNDDSTANDFTAAYGSPPQTGVWTHLVGVYDGASNTLSLYVNGSLSASSTFAGTPWSANGDVQIGRRLYQGTYAEYANAQISDAQIYNTALDPTAVAAINGHPPVLTDLN